MVSRITPKQVARALAVSESSVKRWCDKGVIETEYTPGGHRRVSLPSLMRFLADSKHKLAIPEALGLPATSGKGEFVLDRAVTGLTDALLRGDEQSARQVAIDLYLAEFKLSRVCDEVFALAFERIGEAWSCGDAEVFQERHACVILHRVLQELSTFLPKEAKAPIAIGCSTAGDHYSLATTMAELVLKDCQWNACSLGSNLPLASLDQAIRVRRPKLLWVSCSYLTDESRFLAEYRRLYNEHGSTTAFVVGGKALKEPTRRQMQYAAYCDNMQHLEAFAGTLRNTMPES